MGRSYSIEASERSGLTINTAKSNRTTDKGSAMIIFDESCKALYIPHLVQNIVEILAFSKRGVCWMLLAYSEVKDYKQISYQITSNGHQNDTGALLALMSSSYRLPGVLA